MRVSAVAEERLYMVVHGRMSETPIEFEELVESEHLVELEESEE